MQCHKQYSIAGIHVAKCSYIVKFFKHRSSVVPAPIMLVYGPSLNFTVWKLLFSEDEQNLTLQEMNKKRGKNT